MQNVRSPPPGCVGLGFLLSILLAFLVNSVIRYLISFLFTALGLTLRRKRVSPLGCRVHLPASVYLMPSLTEWHKGRGTGGQGESPNHGVT